MDHLITTQTFQQKTTADLESLVLILFPCDTGTVQERKMENSEEGENASDTSEFDDHNMDYILFNEFCKYKTVIKFGSIAVPMFFTIVVLLSLLGNILVLVILGLFENLKSLTNIFILNLALSDLIFTLGLPFWACSYIWGWTFGDLMCRSVNFVFSAGFHSSIVFLMLMTIQRYVAVVHPLFDWDGRQNLSVILIVAWVFIFASALPAIVYSETTIQERKMGNSEEGENANSTFVYYDYYDFHNVSCQNEALINIRYTVAPKVLTIVVLLSLLGNLLVLVMFGLFENLKSLTNIFILNLALSDLIFTLGLPFWACSYIWSWTFGDFMCKSVSFISSAGFYSSIVFLMLMSIERYVAVVHPRVLILFACDTGTVQERKMENSEEGENANSTFVYYDYYDFHNVSCQNEALINIRYTVAPIVLTIVVLLSLLGNLLVLVMFGLFENLKSLTNIFILNLALSDLIFTLGLPFWACYLIWSWTFGDFMCKSVSFISSAGFYSSIVFLMLMSIDSYVAVVHPRLIGNILVLVILALYKNLKSLINMLILNLALSDLIFTLGLTIWACYLTWSWTVGGFICEDISFVFSAGFYSSIVFLTGMTVQCYVAVVHPRSDWNTVRVFQ
ncbi:hypothetical protein AOLI_G00156020 [Acnodon oligacanthus]